MSNHKPFLLTLYGWRGQLYSALGAPLRIGKLLQLLQLLQPNITNRKLTELWKDEYAGYQELNLSAMMASGGGGLVASPTTPPTTPPMDFIQNNRVKNVRHGTQNREAQRRFRERKEQRQQTLQQKVDGLRVMYQALSEEHVKSTIEVARLQKENDTLRSEVKDVHRQWRLTQTVLQWSQHSAQSPLSAGGDAGFFGYAPYCLGDLTDDPSPYHSPS
ncbi:hypothetical protein EDB80DRAFT_899513 [Ilyonectria destructans]|nr:hypothetical protein EDB80DRAFT_899513 [Ilyonectria destructans]